MKRRYIHHSYDSSHLDSLTHILSRILGVCLVVFGVLTIYMETHAEDLLEKAFYPAKTYDTVINMGSTKNAVGNEIFKESVVTQDGLGIGCMLNGKKIEGNEVKRMMCETTYQGTYDGNIGANTDKCTKPNGDTVIISNIDKQNFCQQVLGGDWDTTMLTTSPPLIIQITKWLLRLTIVLSITMVIYNGVMYIVESAKGGEVKDATKNIGMIVGGILLALLSLGIINLLRSVTG